MHRCLQFDSNISGFISSQNSPKLFCPKNRSFDIDAIYSVIDDAKQYVYIAVTDYLPISSTSTKRSGTFQPALWGCSGLWAPDVHVMLSLCIYNLPIVQFFPKGVQFKGLGSHSAGVPH